MKNRKITQQLPFFSSCVGKKMVSIVSFPFWCFLKQLRPQRLCEKRPLDAAQKRRRYGQSFWPRCSKSQRWWRRFVDKSVTQGLRWTNPCGEHGQPKIKGTLTLYGWCFCFGCFGMSECQQQIFACSSSCFLILSNLIQDLYTSSYVYDVVRKLRSPSAWLLKNHLENTRQEGF